MPLINKTVDELKSLEDFWYFLIKNSSTLKEEDLMAITQKFPSTEATLFEMEKLSMDETVRDQYRARLKSQHDYEGFVRYREEQSEARGEARGEAKSLCLILQQRFKEVPEALQNQIMNCQDTVKLTKALEKVLSAEKIEELYDYFRN